MVADGQPVDPSIVDIGLLTEWMDGKGLGSGPLESVEPLAGGIRAMLPHVDRFLPAHNVVSLLQLSDLLAENRSARRRSAA